MPPDPVPLCVSCRRHPMQQAFRPFCSERCRVADLARWADGSYRVAAEPVAPESSDADPADAS